MSKPKKCEECGDEFEPTSQDETLCEDCTIAEDEEYGDEEYEE